MSYWLSDIKNLQGVTYVGLQTLGNSNYSNKDEFYELELGIVLDIILDETHPIFTDNEYFNII